MANYIMMMGTSSHVGKSILATAMCRILYRKGRKVVPFKAQNMALNSYVREMGMKWAGPRWPRQRLPAWSLWWI